MKRTLIVFVMAVILIFSVLALAACQPTPETAPVVGKGDNHLEEMIASSALSPPPDNDQSLMEAAGAPETYKDSYTNEKGDVTVTIDAKIEVPSVKTLPAIQVKLPGFTQEQVDKFGEYFLKGAPLISEERVRTKAEIEESIINEEQYLQDMKNRFPGGRNEYIEEAENYLEGLRKEYQGAPEERKRTPATLQFQSDENGENIDVMADLGKDGEASFNVYNGNTYSVFNFRNVGKGRYDVDPFEAMGDVSRGMETTREEAKATVTQCLLDLGIADMQIEKTDIATYYSNDDDYNDDEYKATAGQCYAFTLARMVGGIPVSHIEGSTPVETDDPNVPVPEEPDYNLKRDPETLEVYVDDTGIVQFQWTNPSEEVSVLSEHVTFLPFEDVVQRAKDNMFYKNYTAYGSTSKIKITLIKLNMMRIMRKDKPGEFLIVPVWDFIGNSTSGLAGHEEWMLFGDQSYVTINAIDGSSINRYWGY